MNRVTHTYINKSRLASDKFTVTMFNFNCGWRTTAMLLMLVLLLLFLSVSVGGKAEERENTALLFSLSLSPITPCFPYMFFSHPSGHLLSLVLSHFPAIQDRFLCVISVWDLFTTFLLRRYQCLLVHSAHTHSTFKPPLFLRGIHASPILQPMHPPPSHFFNSRLSSHSYLSWIWN